MRFGSFNKKPNDREVYKQMDVNQMNNKTFHKMSLSELSQSLGTSLTNGLDQMCASQLLLKNGRNKIKPRKKSTIKQILGYMFSGFCGVLWISAFICLLAWRPIGNPPDPTNLGLGILLFFVIFLQASFTAFQDWSSDKVMKSIRNLVPSQATVIRNGTELKIPTEELVVGDLLILSYGNKVPADVRIIESHDLKFDKSLLTGESEAIEGVVECTDEILVESKNIGFMTSLITNGSGKGVVIGTGDDTMIGQIASLTNNTNEKQTSLQKEIVRFVYLISCLAVTNVIILVIVWTCYLRVNYPTYIDVPTMLVTCIAVFLAFIPTGLPVAVTLSLLLIAKKTAKHRILVKNLSTIETLSCVNVIASDKTGTLTQNKMFVCNVASGLEDFQNTNANKSVVFETTLNVTKIKFSQQNTTAFKQLAYLSNLCNNSHFIDDAENKSLNVNQRAASGDATDIALLRFSSNFIYEDEDIKQNYTELLQVPFNSKNKWMMKTLQLKDVSKHNEMFGGEPCQAMDSLMIVKGAPDRLLAKCSHITNEDGTVSLLDHKTRFDIIKMQNEWCMQGQRVILICKKKLDSMQTTKLLVQSQSEIEEYVENSEDFCLCGMTGIIDPPREGISNVIKKCRQAGIRVFMITGDYALTAAAIATDIGIFSNPTEVDTFEKVRLQVKMGEEKSKEIESKNKKNGKSGNGEGEVVNECRSLILNGSELSKLTFEEWRFVTKYQEIVFARITPEQKLMIVNEFQNYGNVVGVTGDGVNDAPALKSADIGIAMGSGSEVAMEASQLVLLDNNFSSILIAIENGRLVFENLRKVILYLIPAGSIAEIVPILTNVFLGMPLALSAFQMIAICVLTDMFPAMSLMLEKPETDLLNRPPRKKSHHLVDWKLMLQATLFIGFFEAFVSHFCFFLYLNWYGNFSANDILFVYDKWQHKYKHYTKFQLDEFVFTGQTIVFVCLVIVQAFGNVFTTRTNNKSLFARLPFLEKGRNLWIFVAQLVAVMLMLLLVYVPYVNELFNTRPIPAQFFVIPFMFAALLIMLDELRKLLVRKKVLCFPRVAW